MTLWFDVTDIRDWKHPYLTGIQRTVVNVLSELSKSREDVRLFHYVRSERTLRQTDIHSLPAAVQESLSCSRESIPRDAVDEGSVAEAAGPRSVVKSSLRRRVRKWIGNETSEALRDFRDSGVAVARIFWRKLRSMGFARISRPKIYPESTLFQPGDVCVSLSATWGLPHYGDVIAANKLQGRVKCISLIYDLIPTASTRWLTAVYAGRRRGRYSDELGLRQSAIRFRYRHESDPHAVAATTATTADSALNLSRLLSPKST